MGLQDDMKGQLPLGLVVLNAECCNDSEERHRQREAELVAQVRIRVGPWAVFKRVQVVNKLPKTRSGKILRNTLRAAANGLPYKVHDH